MAILPYYVANLNIEATYAAISGQFAEYPNLCFVDTLDNVAGLGIRAGYQHDMFAGLSDENVARVKRQNAKKISVIIGNPPYNAWQEDFNNRNPNRAYRRIDERIKETYVRFGPLRTRIPSMICTRGFFAGRPTACTTTVFWHSLRIAISLRKPRSTASAAASRASSTKFI